MGRALQALERTFEQHIGKSIEQAQANAAKVMFAEKEKVIQQAVAASGVKPAFRSYVDGRASEDYSKVTKSIAIEWDYRREVVKTSIAMLTAGSPSGPGFNGSLRGDMSRHYKDNFRIFVDDIQVDSYLDVPFDAKEVMIVNISDYARRIEVGKTSDGRPFVKDVEPNVVQRIALRRAQPKFRQLVKFRFGYADLEDPYILKGRLIGKVYINNLGAAIRRPSSRDRKAGQPVRYPAVYITRVD